MVPRIQFIDRVLNFPVVIRRRGTYSASFQKTVKIPQMQLLDKLMTSVVVQRLVPGRDSADNCGGAAVAWGPCGDSAGAVLLCSSSSWTRSFTCPLSCVLRQVVDVPVVLCNGVPQVQFIDGNDVPMIMHVQRSAPHLAA